MIIKNTITNTKIMTNKSICKPQKKIKKEKKILSDFNEINNELQPIKFKKKKEKEKEKIKENKKLIGM